MLSRLRQLPKPSRFIATAALGLLLATSGCTKATRLVTNSAGHHIRIAIEGSHSLESQAEQSVVSGVFGKVTIERSRVKLNAGPWTNIPESVPVDVRIYRHKLSVSAGPVTIKQTSS